MKIKYTSQFKKDLKRLQKQNKEINKLKILVELLMTGSMLDEKYNDHKMSGKWRMHRDCHIEPDWILIYQVKIDTLILERTGSHSELFK